MLKYIFRLLIILSTPILSQLDNIKGDWPFPPFTSSLRISATFAEFRNTESADHFHNAADIPQPDGNPCYPSIDGVVYYKASAGTNSYVRVVTQLGNTWKHFTYLHIIPNPAIAVGDSVKKGKTILGTIASGMGHVHLIERELVSSVSSSGIEINNLRMDGGLTPFVDNWAPIIDESSLKFYTNGGAEKLLANELYGKVDIQIKIEEVNGSSSVDRNNGTYIAGYRIWNESKTDILFEPKDSGVKYRFDFLPNNSYVHNTFVKNVATLSNPVYWLTNGDGANSINSSQIVSDNYFDASDLPKGNYQLEIFSEDTRGNKSNKYFPISIVDPAPKNPIVYAMLNSDNNRGVKVIWKSNDESDIVGYRLYYATDSELTNWQLAADEHQLTKMINEFSISSPTEYKVPTSDKVFYYKLAAVDIAGQESNYSDTYAKSDFTETNNSKKILIVNAFQRVNENGENILHDYIASYFAGLSASNSILISSISHKVFLDEVKGISLQDYDLVIWFTGDNTNHEATIQVKEMSNLALYLVNGGNLLISGSKIGYDLDERMTASTDTLFYHQYLKAKFVYLGDDTMIPASGAENSFFTGITLNYGQTAEEKYPDDIDPIYGSEVLFNYSTSRKDGTFRHAGIGYKGKFVDSSKDGALIYISFPLETAGSLVERQQFFNLALQYFDIITDVQKENKSKPNDFNLSQNYPNPFNPSTTIKYSIHAVGERQASILQNTVLKVYDILGREVVTLVNEQQKAGSYEVIFDAESVNRKISSGIYFYRLQSGNMVVSKKMILIK